MTQPVSSPYRKVPQSFSFYRATLCYDAVYAVAVYSFICPSQDGVAPKWPNLGSRKQSRKIAQGLMPNILINLNGVTPNRGAKYRWDWLSNRPVSRYISEMVQGWLVGWLGFNDARQGRD